MLTVMPGPPNMGKLLGTWLVYLLLVSLFVGYIASNALAPGQAYLKVFQITGAAAFAVYALACMPAAIWGEKEGSYTNSERRVQRVRKAVEPPGEFGISSAQAMLEATAD